MIVDEVAAAAAAPHSEFALLWALADLNVHEKEQTIDIRDIENTLDGVNMQYMIENLLLLCVKRFRTKPWKSVLCMYLSQTTLRKLLLSSGSIWEMNKA